MLFSPEHHSDLHTSSPFSHRQLRIAVFISTAVGKVAGITFAVVVFSRLLGGSGWGAVNIIVLWARNAYAEGGDPVVFSITKCNHADCAVLAVHLGHLMKMILVVKTCMMVVTRAIPVVIGWGFGWLVRRKLLKAEAKARETSIGIA